MIKGIKVKSEKGKEGTTTQKPDANFGDEYDECQVASLEWARLSSPI
jgi:hypothetical protein